MDYYNEIKERLIENEVYSKIKDYSKEKHRLATYFEIGRLLDEAGSKYGKDVIGEYSKKLVTEVGKKYNKRTLFRMKQFFVLFKNEKVSTLLTQLTWSHYLLLLPLKNRDEISYYINISSGNGLTQRQLQEKIKNNEYWKLSIETRNKIMKSEKLEIGDLIPSPVKIKSRGYPESVSEKLLQRLILEDLPSFLKELGAGFTFVDNEYRIKLDDRCNYIDLLLYNIRYKCYVVVELKSTELRKEHIGQIQIYMNYVNQNIKTINENETIGIIICRQNNEYVVKYCSDSRIIAREYRII